MLIKKPFKKGFGSAVAPYYKASAGIVFSLTNTDSAVDNSNATTVTFSSKSFGVADTNRIIVVVLFARTANTALTSVTIGGVAATLVSGTAGINTNTTLSSIYQAAVPSGTTGNVVIVGPSALARCGIGVYRLITGTPTATASDATQSVASPSLSRTIAVPATGAGLAVYGSRDTAGTPTWTNATRDFFNDMTGGGDVSGAILNGTGSITVTGAATTNNECAISVAAWGL